MPADPSISLVIPTIGKPTLARTLASLVGQPWRPGDEVLLIGDGPQPVAAELWDQFAGAVPGRYLETPNTLGFWGHGIRNWVQDRGIPRGGLRAQLDDDDIWTPGALAAIRASAIEHPGRPLVFRMDWSAPDGSRRVLWNEPELREGNVGTPLLVTPVTLGHAPWTHRYAGDFDHISTICSRHPEGPVWVPDVICICRPHRSATP